MVTATPHVRGTDNSFFIAIRRRRLVLECVRAAGVARDHLIADRIWVPVRVGRAYKSDWQRSDYLFDWFSAGRCAIELILEFCCESGLSSCGRTRHSSDLYRFDRRKLPVNVRLCSRGT